MTVLFRNDQTFPAGKRSGQFRPLTARLVPDSKYPALMWRVRWPAGELSDMVNLTRAKDALASSLESEDRRRRGRRSHARGAPVRANRAEVGSHERR
jgi:hypothetical protein